MTLNQLYYFRAAAGQLNFHRTAEQLMISQPSLSAAIASLERELGVPLFLRKGRHLELSKYGLLYFKEVDALLGRLDSVNATLKRAARPGQGHIDVGYIAPLSPKFMPETVRAFLQQPGYEQVTFGFRELPTRELLDGLKTFLYDVVFCIYEAGEPEVEFVPLLDQELVAIVPPDHPLAAEDQIQLIQLAPYPFITYMPHTQIYRDIMEYVAQSGWTPQIFCNATGEASISSLVASGFGVSIVAKTDVLDNSQVKLLHLKDRLYKRTIYMAYRRDEEQPPSMQAFLRFVLQRARAQSDSQRQS